MRDHTKLEAFRQADRLALTIYAATQHFPREERFGLTIQLRRAAVSIAANIVEGSARRSQREYVHFIEIAYASAKELQYELSICERLGYLSEKDAMTLVDSATSICKSLWLLREALGAQPVTRSP